MGELETLQRRLDRAKKARKAAEDLLEEKSREVFLANQALKQVALFAELSPQPVMRVDGNGVLLLMNPATTEVLDASMQAGDNVFSTLPELESVNLGAIINENQLEKLDIRYEGRVFNLVVRGVQEFGYANLYVSDITEREQAKAEILESRRKVEHLLTSISSVLIGLDAEGRITRWNQTAEEILGKTSQEVMNQPLSACGLLWPNEAIAAMMEQCQAAYDSVKADVSFRNAHGKETVLHVIVSPVRDTAGNWNGHLILATDFTQQRHLEVQLRQSQKLESLGQLAAGIAHEINTPIQFIGDNIRFLTEAFSRINLVIDQSKLLLEAVQQNDASMAMLAAAMDIATKESKLDYMRQEIPFAIEESLEGVHRVAEIVKGMKQFSHPGNKTKAPQNLNEAILNTINVARNEWKYVADLTTELDDELPEVPCLVNELNQVFLNIIVNASHAIEKKFKGHPGKQGQITISSGLVDGMAEVRVTDNGTGIPQSIIDRVLGPSSSSPVGRRPGRGAQSAASWCGVAHAARYGKFAHHFAALGRE